MSEQVSYSYARQNLAKILSEAEESQEPVIIRRRGHEDMALIPADELRSLEEALQRALENAGVAETPESLRSQLGLE